MCQRAFLEIGDREQTTKGSSSRLGGQAANSGKVAGICRGGPAGTPGQRRIAQFGRPVLGAARVLKNQAQPGRLAFRYGLLFLGAFDELLKPAHRLPLAA